jgi:glycosyltransferase involved in cell wall biosynthesis
LRTQAHPTDAAIELLIPDTDEADPEISLVVPAMNEEITIADFVAWCHEGLAKAGVRGEILIIDSSTDRTPEIAVSNGARVLRTPKRGLGRAYIDALPIIRGKWIVMGDADCTYDFRNLQPFVSEFRNDFEYVMGSRWKGTIEDGSMPWLHRRFGTPFTTWILNRLYGSKFSDIHCGMRGITLDGFERMSLSSQSWEYASEMVLKSVHMGLRTAEVPVTFLKDREGRVSHHRRMGWFSPFQAAWINLKAMFIYGADFFLVKPGALLLAIGLLLTLPLSFGPVKVGAITFSLFWMLLGLTFAIVGLQAMYLGLLAQVFYDYRNKVTPKRLHFFRYTKSASTSMVAMAAGFLLTVPLIARYVGDGFALKGKVGLVNHLAVTGLLVLMAGFATFTFTLVLHAATQPGVRRDAA